jgi:hypothetical protein
MLRSKAESEAVRVAAIKRRSTVTQPVEGSLTYGISEQLADLFRDSEDNSGCGDCASCAAG